MCCAAASIWFDFVTLAVFLYISLISLSPCSRIRSQVGRGPWMQRIVNSQNDICDHGLFENIAVLVPDSPLIWFQSISPSQEVECKRKYRARLLCDWNGQTAYNYMFSCLEASEMPGSLQQSRDAGLLVCGWNNKMCHLKILFDGSLHFCPMTNALMIIRRQDWRSARISLGVTHVWWIYLSE